MHATRQPPQPRVVYEDNHLLVLDKPSGWVTQGASGEQHSLLDFGKQYLKHKYHKPGNVYLGVVSRLDSLVSGLIVLARTSKAAARLTRMFQERQVTKIYLALVEGHVEPATGRWTDWLLKDESQQRMRVALAGEPSAQQATLAYQTLARGARHTLLRIELETGRKHQIRVQCAQHGWPILGDRKYGGHGELIRGGIGLMSHQLRLAHPVGGEPLEFQVEPPAQWQALAPEPV
jgi:23S rRNA pseudouridine1911/1915/1917 synthase